MNPALHARVSHLGLRLTLLLAVLLAAPSQAQTPGDTSGLPGDRNEIETVLDSDVRARVNLAFPDGKRPPSPPPGASAAIDELEDALEADLNTSGVFNLQNQQVLSVLDLNGDRQHDFVQFASLDNEAVMLNEFQVEGDRIVLLGRVYDLTNGRLILGKRYAGNYSLARRIAHTWSDEVVLFFTGERGIARTQIAFTSDRTGDGNKELYLMDYDGANQRRITGHRSLTFAPTWTRDGDGLAYVSYYEGPPSMYWIDIDSGQKRPLLVDDSSVMTPTLDPTGRRVAFARSLRGNWEIFSVDRNGQGARQLTNSRAIDTNPDWSPNGRQIAFTSDRSGSPQIYVMDADGTNSPPAHVRRQLQRWRHLVARRHQDRLLAARSDQPPIRHRGRRFGDPRDGPNHLAAGQPRGPELLARWDPDRV